MGATRWNAGVRDEEGRTLRVTDGIGMHQIIVLDTKGLTLLVHL